jgi:hypothetical protein
MNTKQKLSQDSTYILEDDSNDEQIVFDRIDTKTTHKHEKLNKQNAHKDVPVLTGKKFNRPRMPEIRENSVPTLHSDLYKYKGPSQEEEVLLAVMDVNLNELKEEEEVLPDLHKQWMENAADILRGAPNRLPPLREVNHKIPLIDENMRYNYHLPCCPDALNPELSEKIQRYTKAGWWEEANVPQAAPMLCVPKKTGRLRTVIDARKRNDNMEKDVTPFPDQEQIRNDVARVRYRSKISICQTRRTVRHVENAVFHSVRHISEPYDAARGLQCPGYIPKTYDDNLPRIHWKICTRIS